MYAVIVANAPKLNPEPHAELIRAADLLIAADGGAIPLVQLGVLPAIVIGDLDSLDLSTQQFLIERDVLLHRFPRAKDETDLELALLYAAEQGAQQIDVLGALGGRWDHTLANVALLAMPALARCRVRLLESNQSLLLVRDSLELHGAQGDTISLIPLTATVQGITTRGLLYALADATLSFEHARGISNVLLEPPGCVTIGSGLLLVVQHSDGGEHQWRGEAGEDAD
jgi:thiamine pyrophosphokinase